MTRGKHAVQAGRRANEAAIAHIDRLTNELLDAKERARRYEEAARRLPAVEAELVRLRKQVENETSDRVEELETAVLEMRRLAEERKETDKVFQRRWNNVLLRLEAQMPGITERDRLTALLNFAREAEGIDGKAIIVSDDVMKRVRGLGAERILRARGEITG